MPISLTNSIDSVANSVSVYEADTIENILDIFLKKTDAIIQIIGVPPETLNAIQKLAASINNDQTFYNTKKPIEHKSQRGRCVPKNADVLAD